MASGLFVGALLLGGGALLSGCGGESGVGAAPVVGTATGAASGTGSAAIGKVACSVEGVVKDDKGVAVTGALVAVVVPGEALEKARVRTGGDGGFCVVGVAPGEYAVTVTSAGATSAYVAPFEVGADKGHRVEVVLEGPGFLLKGRVTGESGAAARTWVLRLPRYSELSGDVFVVETDLEGRYAVRLPPGMYTGGVQESDALGVFPDTAMERDQTVDVAVTRLNPKDEAAPQAVVDWVKKSAVVLSTAEAGKGLSDMEGLRAVVGGARVVALGEATHGTREFFQLKHRMLEFLVEKMGFRSFVIEASFPEALLLDEYVRTGKGDPYAGVAGMRFWTWDTEEVVAMVRWMRAYNADAAHKEKLRFFGNDIQSPAGSVIALSEALGKIAPDLWKDVAEALEIVDDDWSSERVSDWSRPEPARGSQAVLAAEKAARRVAARLDERRGEDVKKLGDEGWALARIHAHVVVDFLEMVEKRATDFGVRDRAMADNTLRLLEMLGPAAKTVLWAHNGHVQRVPESGTSPMGKVLSDRLKGDLVVFGFSFDEGSFRAMDASGTGKLTAFTVEPAPAGSLDRTLGRASLPLFALDLRAATGSVGEWLQTATFARSVGSMYRTDRPGQFLVSGAPAKQYDALFFVAKTAAAKAARPEAPATKGSGKLLPASLENGDFELSGATADAPPPGWSVNADPHHLRYVVRLANKVSSKGAAAGKKAAVLEREPASMKAGRGSLAQAIDAKGLRGKTVRVEGQFQVEEKGVGDEAYLMVRANGGDSRTWVARVPASRGWQKQTLEVVVPAEAVTLTVAVIVTGAVKVKLDDLGVAPVVPASEGGK